MQENAQINARKRLKLFLEEFKFLQKNEFALCHDYVQNCRHYQRFKIKKSAKTLAPNLHV